MTLLKILCGTTVLWLVGCASTPLPPDPYSTKPDTNSRGAPVVDAKDLRRSATPDPSKNAPPASTAPVTPAAKPAAKAATPATNTSADLPALAPITEQQTSSRSVQALAPPKDLWERIRRGYAMPNLESELVRDREQWYATRPDYIFRMTERSKKYLFYIVEELELRNMPTELALLPFIESAFNPQAVSSAKAAGMWQFMPATGKHFELKQNAFRDDRRDVMASTQAALDYLQRLYGMFGDWHLALAAYNWGEGNVGKAIARNQKQGLATAYTDLNMPMETRFYVPKLQAVKNIVSNPQAFGSSLPLIENHPYFQSVTIRRDIDVALAAKLAEVPLDDFKALNPSLNKPVIMAAGTPQILLPWDNAEIFQSNLDAYGGGRLASWTVWVAPSTMHPAEAAKRVNMTEAQLRAVNNIPPRVVIKAGSTLLVPRSVRVEKDVTEKVADNGQVSLAPEVVLRRVVVRAGKGENVASIARRYKVSPVNVSTWNKVPANAAFKVGQQVVLYLQPAPQRRNTAPAKRAPAPHKASKR